MTAVTGGITRAAPANDTPRAGSKAWAALAPTVVPGFIAGLLVGAFGSIIYAAVQRWLPGKGLGQGLVFGVLLLLATSRRTSEAWSSPTVTIAGRVVVAALSLLGAAVAVTSVVQILSNS